MKFIHVSDLHAGITSYNNRNYSRLKNWEDCFSVLIDTAISQKIPNVIIAGDLYDKNIPDTETIVTVTKCLEALSKHVDNIYLVAGNHDINSISVKKHILQAITLPNLVLLDETKFYNVGSIPIVHYHYLKINDEIETPKIPHIVTFHGTVEGSKDDNGLDCRDAHLSKQTLLKTNPLYVALGHIHKRQNLNTSNVPVNYSGSFIQTRFSEAFIDKGFLIVDIDENTNKVTQQFIKTPYIQYVIIKDKNDLHIDKIRNRIVRFDIHISPEEKEIYKDILAQAYFVIFNAKDNSSLTTTQEVKVIFDIDSVDFDELSKKNLSEETLTFMQEVLGENK